MTHTPGPWPEDYVYDAVRHVTRNCDFIESKTDPEFAWDRYKDARLIAAAPDLLAALELIAENFATWPIGSRTGGMFPHDSVNIARAAIAKAKS